MFNLIATIIENLYKNDIAGILELYNCTSPDSLNEYNDDLFYTLNLDVKYKFNGADINDKLLVDRVSNYYSNLLKEEKFSAIVFLLEVLDLMLSNYCNSLKDIDDDYVLQKKLNDEEGNIEIYPKCNCFWKHKSLIKSFRYDLKDYLKNLYFINLSDITNELYINNYLVNDKLFLRAKKSKMLTIGVSPITNKYVFSDDDIEYSTDGTTSVFSIKSITEKDILVNNVKSILELATENRIDLLIFPEMLGNDNVNKAIQDYIDKPSNITPSIIVSPSIWLNNKNFVNIFCGTDSSETIIQHKLCRFPFHKGKTNYLENLKFDEKEAINLFHCEGIGIIAVAICKDLLNKKQLDLLIENLGVTLIISPSFSTGEYPFEITMPQGYPYDCNIIWINSCAAKQFRDDQESFPDIISMFSNKGTITKKTISCDCNKNCSKCMFIYEIEFEC